MIHVLLGICALSPALGAPLSEEGAEPLPPAPTRSRPEPATEPEDPPRFGADFSAGLGGRALLGPWPTPGVHGFVQGRYDAFIVPSEAGGPRLGLGIWAAASAWPLQEAEEDGALQEIRYVQYGVMSVLRHDPAAPAGALVGVGFSRLDLDAYWGGPLALPLLDFEVGVRQRLRPGAFLDWTARAHWGTARSGVVETLWEEWWMVGLSVSPGLHLR